MSEIKAPMDTNSMLESSHTFLSLQSIMSRRQQQHGGLPQELVANPDSLGEHIKTAIDEDWMAFVYFGLSVVRTHHPHSEMSNI